MKKDSHIKEELKIVSRKENEEILSEDAANLHLQNQLNADHSLQNGDKADADLDSGQILNADREGIED